MDNLAGSGEESQKYERTIPKVFSSSLKLIKSHLFPLLIRIRAALDPLVQCAPPLTCFTNLTMTNLQILFPFTLIGTKDKRNTFFLWVPRFGEERSLFCFSWPSYFCDSLQCNTQGCIFRLTCSYPKLTEDHVLTSAYVKIFRTVTRNAVNKTVLDFP